MMTEWVCSAGRESFVRAGKRRDQATSTAKGDQPERNPRTPTSNSLLWGPGPETIQASPLSKMQQKTLATDGATQRQAVVVKRETDGNGRM